MTKVDNTEWYRLYWSASRSGCGPPADWYANCPLSGGIVDWGCFHPNFDCCCPCGINRGTRKKREKKMEKKRKSLEI
ncbi:hypothetical protein GW17_00035208 [Ensete ventricosum]|nr:hypothetical protein GW17_00035208 [Ensete ventricosum]RZS26303.1 hypothetical protein BHM03_00059621 [Ensete ventricosum]